MTFIPRHKVFKESGVWYCVRRSFGLSPHVTVTTHDSLSEAHSSTQSRGGFASTVYTDTQSSQWFKRYDNYPLRIDA